MTRIFKFNRLYRYFYVLLIISFVNVMPILNSYVYAEEVAVIDEVITEPIVEEPPYVYDEATGLWQNGTYAWDPETNQTTPLQQLNYSYNTDTGAWDTTDWQSSQSGAYTPQSNQPVETVVEPLTSLAQEETQVANEEGVINNQSKDNLFFENFYDSSISGTINSSAHSGNAYVMNNTIGGSAYSGTASTYASLLNMIQSSWGGAQAPAFYNATIQGGHYGDLLINPDFETLQVSDNTTTNHALTVTATDSASIQNTVVLDAVSGDAMVTGNTIAGDAESGDAVVVATILNMIQSSIAADKSFIGVVNIIGDFEGDVLLPSELSERLLAAQVPTTTINIPSTTSLELDNSTSIAISTDIEAVAQSGEAGVTHNTQSGSATSGSATTSVSVFNLTGQQVVGRDALLVFINVSGEWLGFLTNNPLGATSSMYGIESANSTDTTLNMSHAAVYNIDNDIQASATSGAALVSDNTIAGNATSGDAYAAVNVMNMVNSNLSFNGWFGALFINVFGNWFGSFGTDTAYGGFSTAITQENSSPSVGSQSANQLSAPEDETEVIATVLAQSDDGSFRTVAAYVPQLPNYPTPQQGDEISAVASASTQSFPSSSTATASSTENGLNWSWFTLFLAVLVVFGTYRLFQVSSQEDSTLSY